MEWGNSLRNVGLQHDSPIIDNCTKLNMEGQTQLVTFKQNCVKLAWAFINIMNVVHHCKILHNDLSKDNIMLHFLVDKPDVVYISMCDWGETRCLQEVTPSLYGFAKEQNATNGKKKCVGGLP